MKRPGVDGSKSKATESQGSPNYRCCWFSRQRLSTLGEQASAESLTPGNKAQASSQYFSSHARIMQNAPYHWQV